MDESIDSCDVLELCDLLEEYKELSEKRYHENALLQQTIQHLKQENISLLNKNEEQSRIIDDLQNNITSLVSDIDSMSLMLSSKDKDISNLSNCLYVIHEKKVNIDDTYSLEQEHTISTLLKEINRIEGINSSNEALLEDYMNIINQKDLEITELQALMRLSKLENNQSLIPSINPTVTVTDSTADSGYLISPMISSNSPPDSSSSSMIISPSTGRLANTPPPPPPPNKAPPVGLTLDYNKLKGKANKSSDNVIDTTAAYHLEVDKRTRKQHGQKKVNSRQIIKQQSSSNQDDSSSSSSSSSSSNSPANSCSNYERTTPHHDDDDNNHNAEPSSSADEDSQTEEEGSPVAVVINRDYSNRSNRSFVTTTTNTTTTTARSNQHRMVTKASLGDNSSR
jgi:hypothetical protein